MERKSKMRFWQTLFITVIAALIVPFVVPNYAMTIVVEALIWGLFAMSLDLLVGYTRLYSFGHVAAYGLGAYSSALLILHFGIPTPLVILLATGISTLIAVPIAWICTRTHGVTFAMLTLAFAQLGYAMLFKFKDITGGSNGLPGVTRPDGPFGLDFFQYRTGYYYMVLAVLIGSFLICRVIVNSPFGKALSGIRENEVKTQALGYNVRNYKWLVVVIAYMFGSLAGALYAPFAGFASPELFFWFISGTVLIMVIIGGSGTLIGPIIGGIFFLMLEHYLSEITQLWPIFFGSIFILFILFAPKGIWGIRASVLQRIKNKLSENGNASS